jgi:hypothetical protein
MNNYLHPQPSPPLTSKKQYSEVTKKKIRLNSGDTVREQFTPPALMAFLVDMAYGEVWRVQDQSFILNPEKKTSGCEQGSPGEMLIFLRSIIKSWENEKGINLKSSCTVFIEDSKMILTFVRV